MRTKLTALIATAALALAGCGVGASSTPSTEGNTIKVGAIPVIDFAPLYVAKQQGFFKEQGITVKVQFLQNAAAIVPAVMNGQIQVGTTANVPFLTATAKGLPLRAVAPSANTNTSPATDYSGLFVAKNSSIQSPSDLEGKKVAVNALNAVLELATSISVRKDGGDPSKVQYVSMPFSSMANALKQGTVDAVSVVEPFYQIMKDSGARLIDNIYTSAFPEKSTLAFFFASQQFLSNNPELAAKFVTALRKAGEYAAEHPEAVRDALRQNLKIDPKLIKNLRLPVFGAPLKAATLHKTAQLMADLGFITHTPKQELVWKP